MYLSELNEFSHILLVHISVERSVVYHDMATHCVDKQAVVQVAQTDVGLCR